MLVQITVQIDGREVEQVQQEVEGTPSEREEEAHRLGKRVGRAVTERALTDAAAQVRHPRCCGHAMKNRGRRRITLKGLDGEVRVPRTRYRCGICGQDVYPADGLLMCGRQRITRPLAKRVCQLATIEHFTELPQLIFDQHGVWLSHEVLIELVHEVGGQADRWRRAEAQAWVETPPEKRSWPEPERTPRRVYVSCDGIMYCTNQREPDPHHPGEFRLIWQQMRVGCVYWQDAQENWHKEVLWGRDSPEQFGASLYRLACRCGYRQAQERIFAADGADWCWSIHQRYFADAEGILDWFHLSEYVWEAARILLPEAGASGWVDQALAVLRDSAGEALLKWLVPQHKAARGKKRRALAKLIGYLQPRLAITDYPTYRARGWEIGTGMIESTARQLVGLRLKGPGMHWSEHGAIAITALRAQSINHHWHQFWNTLAMNC